MNTVVAMLAARECTSAREGIFFTIHSYFDGRQGGGRKHRR